MACNQLYKLPDGRVVKLYDHPTFRPVKMCPICGRAVSKWHEHVSSVQQQRLDRQRDCE